MTMKLRVVEIAKQKGLKLQDVANAMYLTRQSLVNTLQLGNPTYETLQKIAAVLDVPVWHLFTDPAELRDESSTFITCPKCGKYVRITILPKPCYHETES